MSNVIKNDKLSYKRAKGRFVIDVLGKCLRENFLTLQNNYDFPLYSGYQNLTGKKLSLDT